MELKRHREKLLKDNTSTQAHDTKIGTQAHQQRLITTFLAHHSSCYKSIKGYQMGSRPRHNKGLILDLKYGPIIQDSTTQSANVQFTCCLLPLSLRLVVFSKFHQLYLLKCELHDTSKLVDILSTPVHILLYANGIIKANSEFPPTN